MLKTSPKKYQNVLIPSYRKISDREVYCHWKANHSRYIAIGCRRILLDVGYLAALHRPNITLRINDIEAIVEDGIVTKAGYYYYYLVYREESLSDFFLVGETLPFDVIVCATGFTIVGLQFECYPKILQNDETRAK
jgi:hypothetical protein